MTQAPDHQTPAATALTEFEVAREPGNERIAIERVAAAVGDLGLPAARLERLKTAVGEAVMNAIEHGNRNRSELPVGVRVAVSGTELSVRVTDQGDDRPVLQAERPDLEAKLAGEQSPRGWGLFLIESMVDELRTSVDEQRHTIELIVHLERVGDHG